MIKKLMCIILCHRTTHRAATGESVLRTDRLITGAYETVLLYAIVRLPFCERCGKKVHADGETLQYPRIK